MKTIELTQGQVALVDDADYEELSKHKWHALWNKTTRSFYAAHTAYTNGKWKTVYMHRQILDAQSGQHSDHRNHDTLDNQRENLRCCTRSENMQNMKPMGGSSQFKGVSWHRQHAKWQATIKHAGHRQHLGHFTDEQEAARTYDTAARKLFGEFALINF